MSTASVKTNPQTPESRSRSAAWRCRWLHRGSCPHVARDAAGVDADLHSWLPFKDSVSASAAAPLGTCTQIPRPERCATSSAALPLWSWTCTDAPASSRVHVLKADPRCAGRDEWFRTVDRLIPRSPGLVTATSNPMAQGFNPFDAILDKRHYQDPDFRAQSSPFLLAWVQRLVRAP